MYFFPLVGLLLYIYIISSTKQKLSSTLVVKIKSKSKIRTQNFLSKQTKIEREREREIVEKVVNAIGDLEEGKGRNDGDGSDTIVAWRHSGDEREISWSDQGGVA